MSRDPRVDPQEGDIVRNATGTYWVIGRDANLVFYRDTPPNHGEMSIDIEEWQRYAKHDEIVSPKP